MRDAGRVVDIGDKCLHVFLVFSYGSVAVFDERDCSRRANHIVKEGARGNLGIDRIFLFDAEVDQHGFGRSRAERMVGNQFSAAW